MHSFVILTLLASSSMYKNNILDILVLLLATSGSISSS